MQRNLLLVLPIVAWCSLCPALANASSSYDLSDFSTADTGDYGRGSYATGEGPGGMGGWSTAYTGNQYSTATPTQLGLIAPGTIGGTTEIPSGQFTYGFAGGQSAPYMGVSGGSFGGMLPATATSSVDLNVVDDAGGAGPIDDGGSGAIPPYSSGGDSGSGGFPIPLPPVPIPIPIPVPNPLQLLSDNPDSIFDPTASVDSSFLTDLSGLTLSSKGKVVMSSDPGSDVNPFASSSKGSNGGGGNILSDVGNVISNPVGAVLSLF